MARETIFTEQTLTFELDATFGWCCGTTPALFLSPLEVGKTYSVVWGSEIYTVTAYEASVDPFGDVVAIGDGHLFGYQQEDVPFIIAMNESVALFGAFMDETQTRTIGIYELEVGIVLKDRSGNPVTYHPTGGVRLLRSDGSTSVFVNADDVPISVSETIIPDFSNGDITVTPDEGYVFSDVTVKAPEGLEPQYIPEGMYIAGVGPGKFKGGGGGPLREKDVNFYDYDGTLLYAYTVAEATALQKLPELPEHDGLTAQGWNFSYEEIVSKTDKQDIAAMYIPDDGKTRLYFKLDSLVNRSIPIHFKQTVSGSVTIDWGDGSNVTTVSGTGAVSASHSYAAGEYMITLNVANGCEISLGGGGTSTTLFGASELFGSIFTKVHIGRGVSAINDYAFFRAYGLQEIIIPSGVLTVGHDVFYQSACISALTFPDTTTTFGNYAIQRMDSLKKIVFGSGAQTFGSYSIGSNGSLNRLVIPSNARNLSDSMFSSEMKSLTDLIVQNGATGTYPCRYTNIRNIVVPDSITSIGISSGLESTQTIVLGKGITEIPGSLADNSNSLQTIICRGDIKSVGSYAFRNCVNLAVVDLTACTSVPTAVNADVFKALQSFTRFKVPAALLSAWRSATYWSSYASNIISG